MSTTKTRHELEKIEETQANIEAEIDPCVLFSMRRKKQVKKSKNCKFKRGELCEKDSSRGMKCGQFVVQQSKPQQHIAAAATIGIIGLIYFK